jgi:hypothetical protein
VSIVCDPWCTISLALIWNLLLFYGSQVLTVCDPWCTISLALIWNVLFILWLSSVDCVWLLVHNLSCPNVKSLVHFMALKCWPCATLGAQSLLPWFEITSSFYGSQVSIVCGSWCTISLALIWNHLFILWLSGVDCVRLLVHNLSCPDLKSLVHFMALKCWLCATLGAQSLLPWSEISCSSYGSQVLIVCDSWCTISPVVIWNLMFILWLSSVDCVRPLVHNLSCPNLKSLGHFRAL